jgi:hypothetical protein
VAALALTLIVGTPTGRTAAAQFLQQFRGQRLVVIPLDPSQTRSTALDLQQLGTIPGDGGRQPQQRVRTLAEASQRVGFPLIAPDAATLPQGLQDAPEITVLPASTIRFTFDRDRANAHFQAIGRSDLKLPDRFHGSTLVIDLPAMALLHYAAENPSSGQGLGKQGLIVGQAGVLGARVEGAVSLEELRDFLLGLPGLSPQTVQQLRAIDDWRNTLPIPVPVDEVTWKDVTVAGGPGLLFGDKSGLGSAALWQRDGRIYGVAGALKDDDLLRVANSIR